MGVRNEVMQFDAGGNKILRPVPMEDILSEKTNNNNNTNCHNYLFVVY